MAGRISRGEVWLCRFATPDKRRPVLVLGRSEAIAVLSTVLVAPITSTVRGLPSEVPLGIEDGMKGVCAINLDHVQTVRQDSLRRYVSVLNTDKMKRVCRALAIATGCADR